MIPHIGLMQCTDDENYSHLVVGRTEQERDAEMLDYVEVIMESESIEWDPPKDGKSAKELIDSFCEARGAWSFAGWVYDLERQTGWPSD